MGIRAAFVCVHVPEFPVQALLRGRREVARRAVAVLHGEPPLEEVCSANALALRRGVLRRMTKAELEMVADVAVLRRSPEEEARARAALLEAVSAFTPSVEAQQERGAAFELVLDMAGTELLMGPMEQVIERIAKAIHALGLRARLAASANFHAAVALAPFAKEPTVVAPGQEQKALARLPLRALPCTQDEAETFALWGLRSVGELAALPEEELVVRLGQRGRQLHLLARGEHPHLLVPDQAEMALSASLAFEEPVELLDSLLFVLGPMLDGMLSRAQSHALAIASLTLTLGIEGGGEHVRTVKPALPVADRALLLKLLHLDLQAHLPAAAVVSISVQAEPGRQSKVQAGLFSPQTPEPMRLDVTLARLAALVGEDRVGRARLLDTHAPDSFTMERFCEAEKVFARAKTPAPPKSFVALRRCRPPVRVAMECRGKSPAVFFWEGSRYMVEQVFGPWRRSGVWWSASQVWSREEWDVCAARPDGERLLCVLAQDLLLPGWWMDAVYD